MTTPTVQLPPFGPDPPPSPRQRTTLVVIAVTSVLILVLTGLAFLLTRDTSPDTASTGPTATSAPSVPTATGGPTAPGEPTLTDHSQVPTTVPGNEKPGRPSTAAPPVIPAFRYQPLWPFRSVADAMAWQRQVSEGHQPWPFDARLTAVAFARDYLGYGEIDRSTSERVIGDEAWVGVGYQLPDGRSATAAVLHLARIGAGSPRPWEVVGSRDTTLSLTGPDYGAWIRSPVTVSGLITGVDESLTVRIRAMGGPVLGSVTGIPAGGQGMPWSTPLAFRASTADVATIAVSTGGHVQDVERFAITGVRLSHR